VTKRPATIDHAFNVLLSQFPLSSTSFLNFYAYPWRCPLQFCHLCWRDEGSLVAWSSLCVVFIKIKGNNEDNNNKRI